MLLRRGLPSFLLSLPPLIFDSPFFLFHSGIGASTRDLASLFSQETRANGQAANVYTQTCRHNFSLFMHTSVFSSHYHCSLSPAGDFSLRDYKKYANAIVKEESYSICFSMLVERCTEREEESISHLSLYEDGQKKRDYVY